MRFALTAAVIIGATTILAAPLVAPLDTTVPEGVMVPEVQGGRVVTDVHHPMAPEVQGDKLVGSAEPAASDPAPFMGHGPVVIDLDDHQPMAPEVQGDKLVGGAAPVASDPAPFMGHGPVVIDHDQDGPGEVTPLPFSITDLPSIYGGPERYDGPHRGPLHLGLPPQSHIPIPANPDGSHRPVPGSWPGPKGTNGLPLSINDIIGYPPNLDGAGWADPHPDESKSEKRDTVEMAPEEKAAMEAFKKISGDIREVSAPSADIIDFFQKYDTMLGGVEIPEGDDKGQEFLHAYRRILRSPFDNPTNDIRVKAFLEQYPNQIEEVMMANPVEDHVFSFLGRYANTAQQNLRRSVAPYGSSEESISAPVSPEEEAGHPLTKKFRLAMAPMDQLADHRYHRKVQN